MAPSPECCSTGGGAKGGVPPSPPCRTPTLQPRVPPFLQGLLPSLTPGSAVQRERGWKFNFRASPVILLFHISSHTLGLCCFFGRCCSFLCPSHHLLQSRLLLAFTFINSLDDLASLPCKLLDTDFYYFQLSNYKTYFILPYSLGY